MVDIATITPNPALDLSTSVDKILPVAELRGTSERRDPGGGECSAVIKRLGGDAHAIYPAGGVIGRLLRMLLDEEGVASHNSTTAGETREDISVHEISTDSFFPARRSVNWNGRIVCGSFPGSNHFRALWSEAEGCQKAFRLIFMRG